MALFEPKVRQGATIGGAVGVAAWALMALVPAWRDGLPDPVLAALPFVLAWAGHVLAAYRAPHDTSRDAVVPVAAPDKARLDEAQAGPGAPLPATPTEPAG